MTNPTGFDRGAYVIAPNDVISIDSDGRPGGPIITTILAYLRPNSFVKGGRVPTSSTAGYTFGASDTSVSFNLNLNDARLVRRALQALDAKKDLDEAERDALWVIMAMLTPKIREKARR